jgi:Fe-S cluster biogenesis protein NfuA
MIRGTALAAVVIMLQNDGSSGDEEGPVSECRDESMVGSPHPLTGPGRLEQIAATIAAVRPAIVRDGGDLELAAVDGDVVRVRLTGACTHCAMAGQTLGGLRRELSRTLGAPVRVLPALQP